MEVNKMLKKFSKELENYFDNLKSDNILDNT